MTIDEIRKSVKSKLSRSRFNHTLGVVETAKQLAVIYKIDPYKAEIAALLHDIAKEICPNEKREFCIKHDIVIDQYLDGNINLLHGSIGARIAKDQYNVHDQDILNAIENHTLGRQNMSVLEKIIYLADIIEPNRESFPKLVALRELSYDDLNQAMKEALSLQIKHLTITGKEIHPKIYTVLKEYKNRTYGGNK